VRSARATRLVGFAGAACLFLAILFGIADPGNLVDRLLENTFDRLLAWSPRLSSPAHPVVVVIGRDALASVGPWPWPRDRLALLIDKIADAKPKVLAVDILLPLQPTELASSDQRLAQAIARIPTVLALVLDPEPSRDRPPSSTVAVMGDVKVSELLVTPGFVAPAPQLISSAQGLGVMSLPSPEGLPVRAVPLLAGAADTLLTGLAVEALRLAAGNVTVIAAAPPQLLRIGEHSVRLPPDGLLRLHFATASERGAQIVPAEILLRGEADASRLAGKIVFLGASAPEAGGLRLTAVDPLMPSVEIHAEAADQMLSGHVPLRNSSMKRVELAAGALLGIIGTLAVIFLSPVLAGLVTIGLALIWVGASIFLSIDALWLTDAVVPVLVALFTVQGAALAQFGIVYRQRLAIERRFALHLSPEVVRRIVNNPSELKLAGETRTITVLFTDIEGFTALTERLGAEAVVSLLDRYVDTVAGIVVDHGGMVDKFVGDGVLAFFNAPVDLPDHAERAVASACAILRATESFRREPQVAASGLGRTRIGIETGQAVLGEVGRGTKRDYTAYGRVVNLASRLEAANKSFGSSIALGPGTVAALRGKVPLRRLGAVMLSGIDGQVEIYEPKS